MERGRKARHEAAAKRRAGVQEQPLSEQRFKEEQEAAVKIQSIHRGNQARKTVTKKTTESGTANDPSSETFIAAVPLSLDPGEPPIASLDVLDKPSDIDRSCAESVNSFSTMNTLNTDPAKSAVAVAAVPAQESAALPAAAEESATAAAADESTPPGEAVPAATEESATAASADESTPPGE